ncbi:MAG: hypothetical protein MJZ64_02540 [Paludibacteraceae bacterium]|nr:hypothetical protein [Paludibacteraceae bacterium]
MKKLSILTLVAILCCMTSCEKKDGADSFNSKNVVTIMNEMIGLSADEVSDKIRSYGFNEVYDAEVWSGDGKMLYEYDFTSLDSKNNYLFFIANKNNVVFCITYGSYFSSNKKEADKILLAWVNQLGISYKSRVNHLYSFDYGYSEYNEEYTYNIDSLSVALANHPHRLYRIEYSGTYGKITMGEFEYCKDMSPKFVIPIPGSYTWSLEESDKIQYSQAIDSYYIEMWNDSLRYM